MPTRILYWNIRDFARNKISNPNARKRKAGSSLKESEASIDRFAHILWVIAQVDPQIVVVVETETGFDARGRLGRGNGPLGAQVLLAGIRNVMGNINWMMVPPLQTGPNECVSVFYRTRRRYFTGPYTWPGGNNAVAQPPGGQTGPYPTEWRDRLPQRTVPAGALQNAGISERRVAARVDGFTTAAHTLAPGTPVTYPLQRSPYMVCFAETDNNGNVVRNLTLYAVHAPASYSARQYLRDLANVAQIVDGIAANEARVIVGDFNWNLLKLDNTPRTSYQQLTGRGYALAFPAVANPPNPANGYPGYFGTHLTAGDYATIWSTNTSTPYYPGYGYLSIIDYAIDNIFTMYGGAAGGPATNATIMNPVVGSPYTTFAVPTPGTPTGTLPLAIEMAIPPQIANPAPNFAPGMNTWFKGWEAYGHIYSASDHLSLAIDV